MNKRKDLDCYQECRRRIMQEKTLFYSMVCIAITEMLFLIYIYMEN